MDNPINAVENAIEKVGDAALEIAKEGESTVEHVTADAFGVVKDALSALQGTVDALVTRVDELAGNVGDLGAKVESNATSQTEAVKEVEPAEEVPNPAKQHDDNPLRRFHEFLG